MKRRICKSMQNRYAKAVTYQRKNYLLLAIPTMTAIVVVCLFSYIIMMTFTVLNTAKRADYEKKISVVTSSLTELESELSTINKSITPILATAKGFSEVVAVKYVKAKSLSTILMP